MVFIYEWISCCLGAPKEFTGEWGGAGGRQTHKILKNASNGAKRRPAYIFGALKSWSFAPPNIAFNDGLLWCFRVVRRMALLMSRDGNGLFLCH